MSAGTIEPKVETLRDGSRVSIRPIRADDTRGQAAFFEGLSAYSKQLLFLAGVAQVREADLERLCAPDESRETAFVAVAQGTGGDTHVGVCRYASERAPCDQAEISVAVADAWQHKGLATLLLKRLIEHARAKGVKRLYSVDSATNHRMRRLARHLGFSEQPDPDDVHQVIYSMDLGDGDGPAAR